jgi:NADP-dependent 3-hydroxy acid dehydrogenase YdfG
MLFEYILIYHVRSNHSANSGLGKELATYAAAKGAKLYMLCRSKERAEKARDEIAKLTSNDKIEVLLVRKCNKLLCLSLCFNK